jgi:hypothetical protein
MADGLWHMEKSLIKTFRVNGNWQLEFVCDLKFGICDLSLGTSWTFDRLA